MGDGICPAYVRTMWKRWGIAPAEAYCQVPLKLPQRKKLLWLAERAGLTPEQWLERLVDEALAG